MSAIVMGKQGTEVHRAIVSAIVHLAAGQRGKIAAIMLLRHVTPGLDLRDAKHTVEAIFERVASDERAHVNYSDEPFYPVIPQVILNY